MAFIFGVVVFESLRWKVFGHHPSFRKVKVEEFGKAGATRAKDLDLLC